MRYTPSLERPFAFRSECPCHNCKRLQELADEVTDAMDIYEAFETQYSILETEECQTNDPVTNLLPFELVSKIFLECLPDTAGCATEALALHKGTKEPVLEAPLVLGMVCRRWREISAAIPQLWTRVVAKLGSDDQENQLSILRNWIEKSDELPLFIGIYTDLDFSLDDEEEQEEMLEMWWPTLDILNAVSSRWKSLELYAPSFALARLFRNGSSASISTAVSSVHSADNESSISAIFSVGDTALRSQSLHTEDPSLDGIWIYPSNVAQVHLQEASFSECLFVLFHAQSLHSLEVGALHSTTQSDILLPQFVTSQLVHRHLYSLKFMGSRPGSRPVPVEDVELTLPNLTILHIQMPEHDLSSDLVLPFVRATENLQTVVIESDLLAVENAIYDATIDILSATMSATTLRLKGEQISRRFFRHLVRTNTYDPASAHSAFLPNLKRIEALTPDWLPWKSIPQLFFRQNRDPTWLRRPLETFLAVANDEDDRMDKETVRQIRQVNGAHYQDIGIISIDSNGELSDVVERGNGGWLYDPLALEESGLSREDVLECLSTPHLWKYI